MDEYRVELNILEMLLAGITGLMRYLLSVKANRKDNKKAPDYKERMWDLAVTGAVYEMSFAKWLNVYFYPSVNTFKAPDVSGYQVRGTHHKMGRLILRKEDPVNEPYVLVIGENFTYYIKGWMMGKEIRKHDEWIDNPDRRGKCWMVPQQHLSKEFKEKEND